MIDARSIYQFVKINYTCIDIFGYNTLLVISPGGPITLATCGFGAVNFLAAFSTNFLPASMATVLLTSIAFIPISYAAVFPA